MNTIRQNEIGDKSRASNWDRVEKDYLLELVNADIREIENKKVNFRSIEQKKQARDRVVQAFSRKFGNS